MKLESKKITINELLELIDERSFDPEIDNYYQHLENELLAMNFPDLPNQYIYLWDFYKKKSFHLNNNIQHIIGYSKDEININLLYEIIHPADRLPIYLATIKSIRYSNNKFNNQPFENIFVMDFRVKCKNGDYIRIFRETGSAANDRLGNMIFSFAIHTDITDIKKNNKIGFYYKGNNGLIEFPDEELLNVNNVFSKREKEILYHLAKGKLSKEIAEILFISKNTVDTHRRNMLHKAMVKNTPELIMYGLENGVI